MVKSIKSAMLIAVSLLLLVGCQAEEKFYKKIDNINQSVEQADWKQAQNRVKELKEMYKGGEWKLQLLGDETEYEGINVELEKLKEAVAAKDETQVKVGLGTIRGHLADIYSF